MVTSIELVDGNGRKVRVNISGHWQDLVEEVEHRLLAQTMGLGFGLSDYETEEES